MDILRFKYLQFFDFFFFMMEIFLSNNINVFSVDISLEKINHKNQLIVLF